jgi:hypothetical protein
VGLRHRGKMPAYLIRCLRQFLQGKGGCNEHKIPP